MTIDEEAGQLEALREAVAEGLADVRAGRLVDADEVFDRLLAKYASARSKD